MEPRDRTQGKEFRSQKLHIHNQQPLDRKCRTVVHRGFTGPVMLLSPYIASHYGAPVPYKLHRRMAAAGIWVHHLLLDPRHSDTPVIKQVHECALSYCITRHNATMVGSTLQVESSTHAFASTAEYYGQNDAGLIWRSPTSNQPLNDDITSKYVPSKYDNAMGWYVGGLGACFLAQALGSALTGQTLQESFIGIQYDSLMAYESYVTTDFPALIDRVATSLNQVLLAEPSMSHVITGNARSVVSILQVRWEWITLPAVLLTCTLAFLLLTMAISRRRKSLIWKSSSLPLLFHGVENPEDHWAGLGTITQMHHEADKIEVRLEGLCHSDEDRTTKWRMIANQETVTDASKGEHLGTRTNPPCPPKPKPHNTRDEQPL